MLYRNTLVLTLLIAGVTPLAQAGTVFEVTVDTSSISGVTGGALNFQLNGGFGNYDLLSATISNFQTDGILADPSTNFTIGDVSGDLGSGATMDNLGPDNAVLHLRQHFELPGGLLRSRPLERPLRRFRHQLPVRPLRPGPEPRARQQLRAPAARRPGGPLHAGHAGPPRAIRPARHLPPQE